MSAADMNYPPSSPPDDTDQRDPTNYVHQILGLVVVAVFFLFLLHVLGSLRRMTSHKLLHSVVCGTYALSYTLVGYTLGLMNSSSYYVDEFAVWAMCLLLLLGSTDSLTACSLNDIDNWKSFHGRHILKGFMVVYIVILVACLSPESRYLQASLWAILFLIILKSYARMTSMKMASKSHLLFKDTKWIADYMKYEHLHKQPGERPNPVTMEGYRYLITGEYMQKYRVERPAYVNIHVNNSEKDVKIITVEQIWKCKESLLRSDYGTALRLKDLCLSMALSKMLNRRFGGFELSEAGLEKTHDFVFRGLLAGNNPHERAFKVIEAELAFVHDIYYTRYPYHYNKSRFFPLYLPIAMVIICSWLTYLLFKHSKDDGQQFDTLHTTLFIMATVTFLEVFQLYLHLASGWFKVELIRSYVTRTVLHDNFFRVIIGLLLSLKPLRPWQRKLGQYSLLQKFEGTTRISNCFHYVTLCLVDKAKNGRKRGKLVKLSKQVKKTVIDSLIESDGHLTNGVRSLRSNGVNERVISWACDASNTLATHTILIWHIATTLCKHKLDAQAKDKQLAELSEEDRSVIDTTSSVASNLSQYCAYLIAFAPNFLPDHNSVSSFILDQSIKEAREMLKGAKTMESKYEKLMSMSTPREAIDAPLIVLGARLARELTEDIQDPTQLWKVLSDFWAEMVLYIAPSEDSRAHLEALPRGGELVTHLWALLTHAGVLKRDLDGPMPPV